MESRGARHFFIVEQEHWSFSIYYANFSEVLGFLSPQKNQI